MLSSPAEHQQRMHQDKEKTDKDRPIASTKILPLGELGQVTKQLRQEGKKVVLCHGVFDLLHPGHIRHFEEAKTLGQVLVVTVTCDRHVNKGPGRPAFTDQLRAESLAALAMVDYVAISDSPTAVKSIQTICPAFYVKGQDYEKREQDITQGIMEEERAVQAMGGTIHFTHDINFSSSNLLNSHWGVYPEEARDFLQNLRSHHDPANIFHCLNNLKNLKVAIIGDTIIDEYHYCQPMGKSPKETIVTTKFLNSEAFAGGVLACANHVAAFSNHVSLFTCLGAQNSHEEFINTHLNPKISRHFFYRSDGCTVTKRRYVEPAFLTKMFQTTFMTDTEIPIDISQDICQSLEEVLPEYDLVIVADYGHGFINDSIRKVLFDKAAFLAINVQTNSANIGYNLVTKYAKADYICIDDPELRLAMQEKYTPIEKLITEFAQKYPDTTITITRGHKGSVTAAPGKDGLTFTRAPSLSKKIVDRVGAGDAYFAVTAMLAAHQVPTEVLGFVGNAAGALAVEIVCNRSSMEAVPFYKFLKALLA